MSRWKTTKKSCKPEINRGKGKRHASSSSRLETWKKHEPPARIAAQPGHVIDHRRADRDHRDQGQGDASARGKDDHAGQAWRSLGAQAGGFLSDDRRRAFAALRYR